MKRSSHLQQAHYAACEWARYTERLESSGYPHVSAEQMALSGRSNQKPGHRILAGYTPALVTVVDAAMRTMPPPLQYAITARYLHGLKTNRRYVDQALSWISAKLHD